MNGKSIYKQKNVFINMTEITIGLKQRICNALDG